MILIPVQGGLGNQMFFYSFACYLRNRGLSIKFLWFYFIATKHHNGVQLNNIFDLSLDVNRFSVFLRLSKIFSPSVKILCCRAISKLYRIIFPVLNQHDPYSYLSVNISSSKIYYSDGFWQNYRYADEIRSILLEEFKFKLPITYQSDILEKITTTCSVSLHVRRGDYLESQFSHLNVIRNAKYYLVAIEHITAKIVNPIFYVFTDDIIWCKRYLDRKDVVFVEENSGPRSYLDMFLMSKCKHNIISNSTFSWWGAWLNTSEGKIVCRPSMWTVEDSSDGICPPDWVSLPIA